MPAAGPVIACRNLCKTYWLGDLVVHALRDVTLTIASGEYVAVSGASGSGKSTLLNLLGALDTPTSGALSIADTNVTAMTTEALAELRNRFIGFVFQQFNLLPRATALDNVKLPLLYARNRIADPDGVAAEQLAAVGLADRAHHLPSQLSGGQQQRVAIARALVNNPRIVLADEPTGQLDSGTTRELLALLRHLNERGLTIVLVTHEHDVAAEATRRLQFVDGRLVSDERTEPLGAEAPR
ncbi:MAG: ABC transporter ATP-binding protein [Rhodospirillales bacterium]|nr:ABC transporter ATP-binding protein [Rhodospirillales bacterium]